MRKRAIDTIFSAVQQDILGALFDDPDRWWYLTEIAGQAGRTPSSLQRAIESFVSGGLLETRRDGGRVYFRAATAAPLFEPIREIVNRSIGVENELAVAVEPLKERIDAFFIYGSFARGKDGPGSDVDLVSIGEPGLAEVAKVLRPLEKRFMREFNVSTYTRLEFSEKLNGGNHFLNSLRTEQKIFILGTDDVFGRRGRKRPHSTASN